MAINIKKYQHQKNTPSNTSKKQSSTIKELLNKDINLFGNPFNAKEKQSFYANLETLLTAGLDIQRALKLIQEGIKKRQNLTRWPPFIIQRFHILKIYVWLLQAAVHRQKY